MTRELISKGLALNNDTQRLESIENVLLTDADENILINLIREFNKEYDQNFANEVFIQIRNKFISEIQKIKNEKEKELSDL